MDGDKPLLDEDRIDLDEIASMDLRANLYAHDEWIEAVSERIGYDDYTGGRGSFDPETYDEDTEWLMDELAALLIRAHQDADMDLLDFSSALKSTDEQIVNVCNIGVNSYAKKVGRANEFAPGPAPSDESDGEFVGIDFDEEGDDQ